MIYKQGEIIVDSIFNFIQIDTIRQISRVNNHTRMVLRGVVDSTIGHSVLKDQLKDERIEIKTTDDTIIFAGIISNVRVKEENQFFTIHLVCTGSSKLIDVKPEKRSNQDGRDTYADILHATYDKTGKATIYTIAGTEIMIRTPIFQYNETDWKFTHRMAGHLKTIFLPNDQSASPQVCIGIPNRRTIHVPTDADHVEYTIGRNEQDSPFYKYRTNEHMFLGDTVNFFDMDFVIMEKVSVYENNTFKNTYTFGREEGFAVERYNLPLSGLALRGTVLDTMGELLKTHLDIDDEQDINKAFWFSFVPQSGNVMYSMPIHGTKIMLKFNTDEDASPMATECYRENGQISGDLTDYNYRYYTTEFKKRMTMFPTRMFFFGGTNLTELNDNTGIHIKTGKKTHIESEKNIEFHAKKKLIMLTTAHIYMTKFNTKSIIDFAENEINIESFPYSKVRPTLKGKLKPYPPCYVAQPLTISKKLALMVLGFIPKR